MLKSALKNRSNISDMHLLEPTSVTKKKVQIKECDIKLSPSSLLISMPRKVPVTNASITRHNIQVVNSIADLKPRKVPVILKHEKICEIEKELLPQKIPLTEELIRQRQRRRIDAEYSTLLNSASKTVKEKPFGTEYSLNKKCDVKLFSSSSILLPRKVPVVLKNEKICEPKKQLLPRKIPLTEELIRKRQKRRLDAEYFTENLNSASKASTIKKNLKIEFSTNKKVYSKSETIMRKKKEQMRKMDKIRRNINFSDEDYLEDKSLLINNKDNLTFNIVNEKSSKNIQHVLSSNILPKFESPPIGMNQLIRFTPSHNSTFISNFDISPISNEQNIGCELSNSAETSFELLANTKCNLKKCNFDDIDSKVLSGFFEDTILYSYTVNDINEMAGCKKFNIVSKPEKSLIPLMVKNSESMSNMHREEIEIDDKIKESFMLKKNSLHDKVENKRV